MCPEHIIILLNNEVRTFSTILYVNQYVDTTNNNYDNEGNNLVVKGFIEHGG
jgi:hypothetical protein